MRSQLPRRAALLGALLLCSSCIFAESALSPNNAPRDSLDMQHTADSGAGGEDQGAPDLASPPDSGVPDSGMPDSGMPDSGMPDMEVPDSGMPEDMGCEPETNEALCEKFGRECETLTITRDRCGEARSVDCGVCKRGSICQEDGKCQCTREADSVLCSIENTECGGLVTTDSCGEERVVTSCGTCDTNKAGVCEAGRCNCEAPTDQALCGIAGRQCGTLETTDVCGTARMINCGTCSSGTCSPQGSCSVCQPEADGAFCARLGKQCGPATAKDNCGATRTVSCGGCTNDRVCNANSNQCECPAPVCPPNAQCGGVSNACGRSATCGAGCSAGSTCTNNACQCVPETDKQFCDRAPAAQCGVKSGLDSCGMMRTVDCGSCGNAGRCSNNQCGGCTSPDPQQFCADLGVACGPAQGIDSCTGLPRCVQECGMCAMGSKCCNAGGGGMSTSGSVCQPDPAPCTFIPPNIICGAVEGPK